MRSTRPGWFSPRIAPLPLLFGLLPAGLLIAAGVLLGEAPSGAVRASASQLPGAAYREGELLVWLKPGVPISQLTARVPRAMGLQPVKPLSRRLNIWLMRFDPQAMADRDALFQVRTLPEVVAAQFNHYVKIRPPKPGTLRALGVRPQQKRATFPNDPRFDEQWALHNTGQTGGTPDADIDAPEAWDLTTGGTSAQGDEIVVAIIDGGFDLSHPDVSYWKNTAEVPNNDLDDDGNRYVDDYDGWDAYDSDGTLPLDDHGTHVAGIAAAVGNNNTGVSGVNWGVKVMPIAGASGVESVVVEAYSYVLEMRARYNETNGAEGAFVVVTNASFGVDFGNPDDFPVWCGIYDSLGQEGVLSVAATANLNINVDVEGDVPTACPSDYLIAVTNTTDTDQKYPDAAYGPTHIDLGSPGTNILSTVISSYDSFTGTSMAAPHVTGAVALMFAAAPSSLLQDYKSDPANWALTFKTVLLNNVDPISDLQGKTVTGGRLNAFKAVQAISQLDPDPTAAVFVVENDGTVRSDRAYFCGLSSGCFNAGTGADLAERIDVSEPVEPGDVVEIDPHHPKRFRKARGPFSDRVVGVIASSPGITLGNRPEERLSLARTIQALAQARVLGLRPLFPPMQQKPPRLSPLSLALREPDGRFPSSRPGRGGIGIAELARWAEQRERGERVGLRAPGRPLLALLGRVYVKATAENGPIRPGDLLTTAPRPGYVMRCPDPLACEGAVVGKALEPLPQGRGLIRMLVMR